MSTVLSSTPRAIAVSLAMGFWLAATAAAQTPIIPPGTEVVVRTAEAIDSRNVDLSREYLAVLDEPLLVNGNELAAKGADVVLRVVEAGKARAVRGRASLVLQIAAVVIDGTRVPIVTDTVKSESGSQAGKAAKVGAGGAAIGAVLGGLFGGASGAAQGAAIGAGAGVGTAALTGQRIQVPAESRLTFVVAAEPGEPLR